MPVHEGWVTVSKCPPDYLSYPVFTKCPAP